MPDRANPSEALEARVARRTRLFVAVAVAAAAVAGAMVVAVRWVSGAEVWYIAYAGPTASMALTAVTRQVPFSLGEVVVVLGLVWLALPALVLAGRVRRGEVTRRALVRHEVARLAATGAVAVAVFYPLWGFHYTADGLAQRLGWAADAGDPDQATAELERLAAELVAASNAAYEAAHQTRDLGHPSTVPDVGRLDAAIDAGLSHAAGTLGWSEANARARGRAKPLVASPLMSRAGLLGVYFPWTGEANFNAGVPGVQLPHTIAHEKAHQRGVASEDEANFVGYLAGSLSPDPYARYSAYLFAQRQLLRELQPRAPESVERLVAERLPGVQRDVDDMLAYWRRYEGPARDAQRSLNDAYLTFHGVEGGVESYARSAQLLVLFARSRGGSLVNEPS